MRTAAAPLFILYARRALARGRRPPYLNGRRPSVVHRAELEAQPLVVSETGARF